MKAASSVARLARLVFVGPEWVWRQSAETVKLPVPSRFLAVPGLDDIAPCAIKYGTVSALWGRIAMECVRTAAEACLRGDAAAMVTAPLTKAGIRLAGYTFEGHTDFLAQVTGAKRHAMMLSAGPLRVVLATVHQSLRSVPDALTSAGILEKIELAHEAGVRMGMKVPRIAVCGLNPHAGESGAFGDEETKVIIPAIKSAQQQGLSVSGPHSPDIIYREARNGMHDFVIAMYHDQGLIPVKLLDFDHGVNTTLGLPIVRTSPDHGSAYDIAGKGVARADSMVEAIRAAVQME